MLRSCIRRAAAVPARSLPARRLATAAFLLVALLGATAADAQTLPAASPVRGVVVYVQPLGDGVSAAEIDAARQALVGQLGAVVRVLEARPLPAAAYYPARDRYRAEKLLGYLVTLLPPDGDRVLGVTARDISTTRGAHADWGMVGLSDFTRPVGVVSSYRLGAPGGRVARERLAKIAVHEVGHSLGLPHCPAAGCVMQDARGRVSICERMDGLCDRCRDQLEAAAWSLPEVPAAPWAPRPIG